MKIKNILIANRGEIAVRVARTAAELGIASTAVYSKDDETSRHRLMADHALALDDVGARAYLNGENLIRLARENRCDSIHPGYGFLSENADFAEQCGRAGIVFIGPDAKTLRLLGDKIATREIARKLNIPLAAGTSGAVTLEQARAFFEENENGDGIMIKALAGGGGRGMRIVREIHELAPAFERCASEARAAFGRDELYVERFMPRVRHVEVQVLGDARGNVIHLWERDCTLQRRNQKLVEIAPAPELAANTREKLFQAALDMARDVAYRGPGTFEFLVDPRGDFVFMEANPRLQVEHTITEEITGTDLVAAQIRVAGGESLADLGLEQTPPSRGFAVQMRVNAETMNASGEASASEEVLGVFEPPFGPGIRVDTFAYAGYAPNPNFDSLLAKLIVYSPSSRFADVRARAYRAALEFRIEGPGVNLDFHRNVMGQTDMGPEQWHTRYVDENMAALTTPREHRRLSFSGGDSDNTDAKAAADSEAPARAIVVPPGAQVVHAPMRGRVFKLEVSEGDGVEAGATLAILDAMKMEHVIAAPMSGYVAGIPVEEGGTVREGQAILFIQPADVRAETESRADEQDPGAIRADLQEVLDRKAATLDEARPRAVAKRHKRGQRTARENITDLCDADSFAEYGGLALAAQRRRRTVEELIKLSPADGLVAGLASVNGNLFAPEHSRCAVMSYDYTVFAGTQGAMNHKKTDRLLGVAAAQRLPLVVFAEGGGGRPGDVDVAVVAGLDLHTFQAYAGLSGLVPRIAVVSGRCFAGNAALAGCSDIIIATEDATMGMGGPVMIKGGGLGNFRAEEVGPMSVQAENGVVDLVVADEGAAVAAAKQALSYFQGPVKDFSCADQNLLRRVVPENRLRAYDTREAIELLADTGSVLELRKSFAPGMITALIRVGGRPMGLMANNPGYMAGAIDADGADKASRFMQLCDAFDLPLLSLCDTPGIMVGPEAEKRALVRHASRLFINGASVDIPIFTVVLRKGYGLGAMAMAGGGFHSSVFTIAWPTGEFGAMGLEGAVETGFAKELAEIKDWKERRAHFEKLVAELYEHGKALNMASFLEIDDVIDPAATRDWILRGLHSLPPRSPGLREKKKRMVDSW